MDSQPLAKDEARDLCPLLSSPVLKGLAYAQQDSNGFSLNPEKGTATYPSFPEPGGLISHLTSKATRWVVGQTCAEPPSKNSRLDCSTQKSCLRGLARSVIHLFTPECIPQAFPQLALCRAYAPARAMAPLCGRVPRITLKHSKPAPTNAH